MNNELETAFLSRGVVRGNTLLLPPPTALEFLNECQKRGIPVLGFDAFRLLPEGRIQPIMDDSLDLSAELLSSCDEVEGLRFAQRFIEDRLAKDILFEMATG